MDTVSEESEHPCMRLALSSAIRRLSSVALILFSAIRRLPSACRAKARRATADHLSSVLCPLTSGASRFPLAAFRCASNLPLGHAHLHIIPRYTGDAPVPPETTTPPERGQTGQADVAGLFLRSMGKAAAGERL